MSGVTIEVNDDEVSAQLAALAQQLGDLTQPMREIGETLVASTMLTFTREADPWGRAWAPLSPVTLARRREGPGSGSAQILRDTGQLSNSFSAQADANSVRVGTNLVYASTHQFGAKQGAFGTNRRGNPIPWGDIPARAMLPIRDDGAVDLPEEDRAEILAILARHLDRVLADG